MEFPGPGLDDHIIAGDFPIVDGGLLYLHALDSRYRNILNEVDGIPAGGYFGHRADGNPVAVGVLEVHIYPGLGLRGEEAFVQFPGGKHHLAIIFPDLVAIHIYVYKAVILAQGLQLV